MNTRSVSFVERLELDFTGNHFCHALTLGDVDGDGLNEFIIGNVEGTLAIFKGTGSSKPYLKATGLGSITCVTTGDLFNNNKDELICINAMGMCFVFTVYDTTKSPSLRSRKESLIPSHTQELPPNIKVIMVAGIAPDGKEELFVGHTDRYVGVYRWNTDFKRLQLQKRIMLERQIGSLSVAMTTEGRSQVLVSQVGGTYVPLEYIECSSVDSLKEDELSTSDSISPKDISMSMDETIPERSESDEKRRQSDSVVNTKPKRHTFRHNSLGSTESVIKKQRRDSSVKDCIGLKHKLLVCPIVGLAQRNSPSSLTEVIGDLCTKPKLVEDQEHYNIVSLCTLDGCIRFIKDERKIWEHQVDHNLFAMAKLDITNDGQDEIIVCAWNGTTYILDHSRNVVRYKFEDNVCAFCAGSFGFVSEHNKPCLIYSTFFNKIYIYHNIYLPSISPSSLILKLSQDKVDSKHSGIQFLQSLSDEKKRKLIQEAIYHPDRLTINSYTVH